MRSIRPPRTGISSVAGVVWAPSNGKGTTPTPSGRRPVLNALYREREDGPQLSVTLIPVTEETLMVVERASTPAVIRFHGRPRPWKAEGRGGMAVMCDMIDVHPVSESAIR